MKTKKILKTWIIMLGALPRGIAAFVITITGLCVGLPLAIFIVGLPILAGTLIACEGILKADRRLIADWESQDSESNIPYLESMKKDLLDIKNDKRLKDWRGWKEVLGDIQSYRSLIYGIIQFPISIYVFVQALIIPIVTGALILSPLAEFISLKVFSFDLFADDWFMNWLFSEWSTMQRAWFNTGLGILLLFAIPFLVRKLGGYYATWIHWASGTTK
ncbi:sensor domain-containing protein [Cohnella sp. WQ 127256]|uniref:sensor domain-containing protein n=1 Tax=Cohnella sp. WQ 127256 TaxID=2938790 RepID=UPI002118B6A6|nr:sensor domain-containing protein [Cohnella sp. WQ 127256]